MYTILIEPNQGNRQELIPQLEKLGYEVTCASDHTKALSLNPHLSYDLVISAHDGESLNCFSFAIELEKLQRETDVSMRVYDIPIIALTLEDSLE